MLRIKHILLIVAVLLSCRIFAQLENIQNIKKRSKTVNNAVLINAYYTALFPLGELSNRFGFGNNIGLNVSYKIKKNWQIGVEGAYYFGTDVKETSILNSIVASTGQLITTDGVLDNATLALSGFDFKLRVAKVFTVSKKHPNSGVMLSVAGGFLQHKIWINVSETKFPQLDKTYRTGYDRLTNGPEISTFLGYLYLERKKFLSFYGGVEFGAAFTKNQRAWNFDEMRRDDHQRYDMFVGIKVGWVIPIFTNKDNEEYYR